MEQYEFGLLLNRAIVAASSSKATYQFAHVGSSSYLSPIYCNDVDLLVLIHPSKFEGFEQQALSEFPGYYPAENAAYDLGSDTSKWLSLRRDKVNLIVTHDQDFYNKTVMANTVCAMLKLEDKVDRIKVFAVVQHGLDIAGAQEWVRAWENS